MVFFFWFFHNTLLLSNLQILYSTFSREAEFSKLCNNVGVGVGGYVVVRSSTWVRCSGQTDGFTRKKYSVVFRYIVNPPARGGERMLRMLMKRPICRWRKYVKINVLWGESYSASKSRYKSLGFDCLIDESCERDHMKRVFIVVKRSIRKKLF